MSGPRFDEIDGEEVVAPSFDAIEGAEEPGASSIAPEPFGAEEDTAAPPPEPSAWGSAVNTARGALAAIAQGPAMQWADEFAGLDAQMRAELRYMSEGGQKPNPEQVYRDAREKFRNVEGAFRQENPAAAFALTAGSGALLGGPIQSKARGLTRYIPSLIEGGISGAGAADEASDMGLAASVGAPLGVAGQAFGEVAGELGGRALQKGGQGLKDAATRFAQRRALAATGYIQKDLKPFIRRDPALVAAKGQALLDEPGIIQGGRTVSDVAANLEPAVEKYGQEIGRVLREADATGAKYDMEPFLKQVEDDILQPIRGDPVVAREVGEIDKIVDGYRALAASKGGLTFSEANAMKTRLQNMSINWGNFFNENSPSQNAQQFKVHLQNLFLNSIDEQIGEATTPEIAAAFKQTKNQYGTMVDALDKARMGRARMEGNKQFSITDYLAALGGVSASMATGDVTPLAGGVGLALANKVARERGPSAMAVLGRAVGNAPINTANPQALGDVGGIVGSAASRAWRGEVEAEQPRLSTTGDTVEALVQSNPEALGPYAQKLQQAAADGNLSLVHYVLQQKDPQYRALLEQARTGAME